MAVRESKAQGDEPIITRERVAVENGSGIRSNLTNEGGDILEIEPGDTLIVDVYLDRIEIRPKGE